MSLERRVAALESEVLLLKAAMERILSGNAQPTPVISSEELITVKQAAVEFSVPNHLLYDACATGRLTYERRGRNYFLKRRDIQQWIAGMQDPKGMTGNVDEFVTNYLQRNPMRG